MNALTRSATSVGWAWGCVIGIGLGAFYIASPLTVLFVVAMTGLFAWVGRGLGDRERRYVWGILTVAVTIRLLVIAVLFVKTDSGQLASFPWDGDGVFLKYRALVIRDVWMGAPVSTVDLFNSYIPYYGWSSFIYVLAFLQYLTGASPYGVHLFNVALFVTAAAMMHPLIRAAYGQAPALIGLSLMLLLPTLIAWSASALKESLCVFLFAAGLRAAVAIIRGPRIHHRMLGLVMLAGAIAAVSSVRVGAAVIMIAGLGAGLAGTLIIRRSILVLLMLVCLPPAALILWERPAVQARVMAQLNAAALYHRGNFMGAGDGYSLLDERFYRQSSLASAAIDMKPDEGLRFTVRALASFVVLPLPWQISSRMGLVIFPQQLVWYMLVPLAFVGLFVGLRRDALTTCLLAGLAAAGSAVFALNNGNIGTMVRFRDWIVPFVVWLSALGVTSTVSRIMPREEREEELVTAGGAAFPGGQHNVSD